MFIIIGIMLTGMLFGYLLRSKRLTWIHKIITFLIWVLLFLLGIDVGGNDIIVKGLHTLGLEALIITLAAVIGAMELESAPNAGTTVTLRFPIRKETKA